MEKYYPPKHDEKQFHCIHCGVYAAQHWYDMYEHGYKNDIGFRSSICSHCNEGSYWYNDRMIVPAEAPVPPAHHDLPEECIHEYNEAREIVARSPRAASALLRLAVQKLMAFLGESGKNINKDIGNLVEKGLPVETQQALDYCRVVGNHAVHPGKIDLNDTPEIAYHIFEMINFIVDDQISRPKEIQKLYEKLPENARSAIEKRDE